MDDAKKLALALEALDEIDLQAVDFQKRIGPHPVVRKVRDIIRTLRFKLGLSDG